MNWLAQDLPKAHLGLRGQRGRVGSREAACSSQSGHSDQPDRGVYEIFYETTGHPS